MPQAPSPMMNTSVQITTVEVRIRIPDWRTVSPKKRSTRKPNTSRRIRPANWPISPVETSHEGGETPGPFT